MRARRALTSVMPLGALSVMVAAAGLGLAVPATSANASGRLQQTSGLTARTQGLIAHLGFERGVRALAPASSHTRIDQVRGGHAGSRYAARLRPPAGTRASLAATDSPSLLHNTSRRQRYHVSVWVKANSKALSGGRLPVRVALTEVTEQGRRIASWRQVTLTGTKWREVSVPLTARDSGHHLDIAVRAEQVRPGGAVRVDDVSLRREAAPAAPRTLLRRTLFGTSIDEGNGDWLTALHRADRRFDRLDVVRVYDPALPSSWGGRLGELNRPFIYSFRATPSSVVAGKYDRQIRAWFKAAPRNHPIWWSYQHEPEDDIERGDYGAYQYRQAWQHINQLANAADNPHLHPTLILMCWTVNPQSGRSFSDYYPGNFIAVLAWDCYNPFPKRGYMDPARLLGPAARKTAALHKRFGIAEFGSVLTPGDDGSRRADWVAAVARYAARQNAAFVSYWDARIPNENYQLRELPSRNTWRRVVSTG